MKKATSPSKSKHAVQISESNSPKKPASQSKSNFNYSYFDYSLMIAFGVLILLMCYLKFAEDHFVQNTYKIPESQEIANMRLLGITPYHLKSEIQQRFFNLHTIWYFLYMRTM